MPRLALALSILLVANAARAETPPDPAPPAVAATTSTEPLERPTSGRRRVVQVVGLLSLGLVIGGAVSWGVAVARFDDYRNRCNGDCTASEVADGKLAQTFGWAFAGAGVALGLVTLILAYVDGRPEPKKVALVPGVGSLSLIGRF